MNDIVDLCCVVLCFYLALDSGSSQSVRGVCERGQDKGDESGEVRDVLSGINLANLLVSIREGVGPIRSLHGCQ